MHHDIPVLNPNPVLQLNAAGELQFSNPAAAALAAEFSHQGPARLRPQLVQAAGQAIRAGQLHECEISGGGGIYQVKAVPVPATDAALLYLTDVTAWRQTEQDAHDQREFYENIIRHLPAVVAVFDADQRYLYLNPHAEPEEAARNARLGRTFAEHSARVGLPPTLAARRSRLFERAVQTRAAVSWEEHWPAYADRPPVYWLCSFQPMFRPDGVLDFMMGYGLDITTRHEAEARTRASEDSVAAQQAFTSQVLDLTPNLIYVRGADRNILFANRAMRHLRQLILDQSNETSVRDALTQEEMQSYTNTDDQVLATGEQVEVLDHLTLPSGEGRWFQTVKCPLTPADGGARQVLAVSTDITALKDAQQAAEAAATARENFLANMSHEIRTPLNGVLGMTSLLAKTELNEQQRSYLQVIQGSGRHLLNVVNDVLDMAKITSGKLDMESIAFNLCDVMGQAAHPLAVQAQHKGIRVVGTLLRESCPHPWVLGDPHRLSQILINLVSNAVKFTPPGGTVTIGGYFVSETEDSLTTEFRVTDTGIGIEANKLEHIFQEFTQAYADTTRQFGGTGLGLSISRALVQQLGGTLSVTSEAGKGSSFAFQVTLPKATPDDRATLKTQPTPLADAAVRGRRVLLVEDNDVNREVALLLLEGHGMLVDEATSGHAALELFEVQSYDVVLMDIQMPGMNGMEATARIRQHPDPVRAATPILALTANAFRADADKYRAAGMNDTLSKPFDETALLAKISTLLGAPFLTNPAETPPADLAQPPAEAEVAAAPAAASAPPPTALPYDLTQLRQTAHGSTVFINRVLASFHANTPASLDQLQESLAAADWPALAALAHKLRPSLRLLGAAGLVPLLLTLEDAAASDEARAAAGAGLVQGLRELLAELPREVEG